MVNKTKCRCTHCLFGAPQLCEVKHPAQPITLDMIATALNPVTEKDDDMTDKPGADFISGNARENFVACMGELALLQQALIKAQFECFGVMTDYSQALAAPLPAAAAKIEAATDRATALYASLETALHGADK